MNEAASSELAVQMLREVIVALVRRDGPALSAHQLAVYLTCYLKNADHTVRGLAAELAVSKSVITRSLDKLGELNLTRRAPDPVGSPQHSGGAHLGRQRIARRAARHRRQRGQVRARQHRGRVGLAAAKRAPSGRGAAPTTKHGKIGRVAANGSEGRAGA